MFLLNVLIVSDLVLVPGRLPPGFRLTGRSRAGFHPAFGRLLFRKQGGPLCGREGAELDGWMGANTSSYREDKPASGRLIF